MLLSFMFLVNSAGASSVMWSQTYGTSRVDVASSLVETSDGGFAIAGTIFLGGGSSIFWLVKTDANGNVEWNQTYAGEGHSETSSLIVTSDGGFALTGFTVVLDGIGNRDAWMVKTDANGNVEWNLKYGEADWANFAALFDTSDAGYSLTNGRWMLKDIFSSRIIIVNCSRVPQIFLIWNNKNRIWILALDFIGKFYQEISKIQKFEFSLFFF